MKTNHETQSSETTQTSFTRACLATCEKLIAQIENARAAVVAEFRETVEANERLLHLAMNEAEALAWQTTYPHLVFPALAAEKAREVATWQQRQQSLWQGEPRLSLAA